MNWLWNIPDYLQMGAAVLMAALFRLFYFVCCVLIGIAAGLSALVEDCLPRKKP